AVPDDSEERRHSARAGGSCARPTSTSSCPRSVAGIRAHEPSVGASEMGGAQHRDAQHRDVDTGRRSWQPVIARVAFATQLPRLMMPVAAASFATRVALLFALFTCGPYACSPKSSGGADRGES